jgi:cAMP-dependent protein kinase regulator
VPFAPPFFAKSAEEKKLIKKSFEGNFVFNDLMASEIDPLVDAFERVEYNQGATIVEQGAPDCFFYVVQNGEVSFHVNNDLVSTAKAGDTFGELALLHSGPRAASVKAEKPATVLFRMNQPNFRHILREQVHRSEDERTKLLRTVPFFKDVDESDLRQLSSAMVPHIFKKGDNLAKTFDEVPFCLVQEGDVVATDSLSGNNACVESFGEEALSKKEASMNHITALSDGVAFTIDRESFEKVFGDMNRLTRKSTDKKILVSTTHVWSKVSLQHQRRLIAFSIYRGRSKPLWLPTFLNPTWTR